MPETFTHMMLLLFPTPMPNLKRSVLRLKSIFLIVDFLSLHFLSLKLPCNKILYSQNPV
jgi:hypothetical protein